MSRRVSLPAALSGGPRELLWRFLRVPLRLQTYKNLLYLSLLFPVGLTYFTTITVALSVGLALSVLLVGIPILLATVYAMRELTAVERFLADRLLAVDVPAAEGYPPAEPRAHLEHVFGTAGTWTGAVFLVSKFALGTGAFVLLVVGAAIPVALLSVPLYYREVNVGVNPIGGEMAFEPSIEFALQTWQVGLSVPFRLTTWYVTTLPEALAVSGVGLVALLAALHAFNVAARLAGLYARVLLADTDRSSVRRLLDA